MKEIKLISIAIALLLVLPAFGQRESVKMHVDTNNHQNKQTKKVKGYQKLKKLVNRAIDDEQYDKAICVMEELIKYHSNRLNKDDVLTYYFSLIREGRVAEIPQEKLSRYNKLPEVKRVIDIAGMRKFNTMETDMERVVIDLDLIPKYGILYQNDSIYYVIGDVQSRKYKLCSSSFGNGEHVEKKHIGDTISSAHNVIYQYQFNQKGRIYNIIPKNDLPARIITRGKGLPNFGFNSRTYSCTMPYFDDTNQRLYFCSDMPGGYGGWDIYYSDLKKGKWEKPVLMGPEVNTALDELFPIISKDCLIFSSDGHKLGKGGFDNYAYGFNDYPSYNLFNFNTEYDDYSLNFLNKKNEEIFAICVSNDQLVGYRPISVIDLAIEKIESKREDQERIQLQRKRIDLQPENSTNSDKMLAGSNIHTNDTDLFEFSTIQNDAIYFDFDNSKVKHKYSPYLQLCIDSILKNDPNLNLLVFGRTDQFGTAEYNNQLALNRAKNTVEKIQVSVSEKLINPIIPVVLGESIKDSSLPNSKKRTAFVKGTYYQISYPVILALPKKQGQTLEQLSGIYNNSIDELKRINQILQKRYSNLQFVGIKGFHKVKSGENLYRISKNNNVDLKFLKQVNFLKSNQIKPNDILIIPVDNEQSLLVDVPTES